MTAIFVSSVIDAPAADVWAIVRDFNGMPQWHPLIADSLIENGLTLRPHRLRAVFAVRVTAA